MEKINLRKIIMVQHWKVKCELETHLCWRTTENKIKPLPDI
jgi:hypothetical protein